MEVAIETGGHWPEAVERLLRGLPEWFGMEQAQPPLRVQDMKAKRTRMRPCNQYMS